MRALPLVQRRRTTARPLRRIVVDPDLGANTLSDSAGEPRRDLLDYPGITVGIVEGAEGSVALALGVGAAEPRLPGKRGAVPHFTRVDATIDEFVMGSLDVGNDQCPLRRAWRGASQSLTERDRAR
jgi:hypothetical protein